MRDKPAPRENPKAITSITKVNSRTTDFLAATPVSIYPELSTSISGIECRNTGYLAVSTRVNIEYRKYNGHEDGRNGQYIKVSTVLQR